MRMKLFTNMKLKGNVVEHEVNLDYYNNTFTSEERQCIIASVNSTNHSKLSLMLLPYRRASVNCANAFSLLLLPNFVVGCGIGTFLECDIEYVSHCV